jgi:hypothetical protein
MPPNEFSIPLDIAQDQLLANLPTTRHKYIGKTEDPNTFRSY